MDPSSLINELLNSVPHYLIQIINNFRQINWKIYKYLIKSIGKTDKIPFILALLEYGLKLFHYEMFLLL